MSFRKVRFFGSRNVRVLWWFIPEHTSSWLSSNFFLLYRRFKRWTLVTHRSILPRFLLRNRKPPSRRSLFLAEEDKRSPQGGWQLFCFCCTTGYNFSLNLDIFTLRMISLACCFPKWTGCLQYRGGLKVGDTLPTLQRILPYKSMQFFVVGEFWVQTEHFQENLYC